MEPNPYESIHGSSVTTHMVAGAIAGVLEHCIMYPVDSVKTRMQSLRPSPDARYKNIPDAFSKIIKREGIYRPIRGMSIVVAGAGPAHALYFSCYEKMKVVFSSLDHKIHREAAHGLSASISTLIHDAIMNPAEMIKQRMQMFGSPYKTCTECISHVWKTEGMRAFYRSYTTQLTMNVPYQAIHFTTYEYLLDCVNRKREYRPLTHVFSGAFAGAFAAAVTTPLDVCKTLLNTQEKLLLNDAKHSHKYRINGLVSAAIAVYEHSGFLGYTKGMKARIIFQMPAAAISWSVYEFFKYTIGKRRQLRHQNDQYPPVVLQKTTIEDKHEKSNKHNRRLVTPLTVVYNDR